MTYVQRVCTVQIRSSRNKITRKEAKMTNPTRRRQIEEQDVEERTKENGIFNKDARTIRECTIKTQSIGGCRRASKKT
jgi:hypothetical protein